MNNIDFKTVLNTSVGGFTLGHIITAIIVFAVCIIVIKLITKVLNRILAKSSIEDKTSGIILKIVKFLLYVVAILITASKLGIDTTSLVALVSVFSLGATLAAEDVIANIAGGIVMMITRPFTLGDYIEAGGEEGNVSEIHLNHTRLKTLDGYTVIIPNKQISSSKIINYTSNGTRRVAIAISASYEAPTDAVRKACLDAMARFDTVLKDPAPAVFLTNYGESAIEYTIYCWTKVADFLPAKLGINEAIREEFAKNNIEMTYNHINVHIQQ